MLTDLAFDLSNVNIQVEIVTSRLNYDNFEKSQVKNEIINGVFVHRVWTSRFGRASLIGRAIDYGTFYFSASWKILWLANSNTTIVSKTDPPLISLFLAPIAKIRQARYINWLQDLFPEVASELRVPVVSGFFFSFLKKLRNYSLLAAESNIVLGHRMAELVNLEGVPAEKIQIIPNWADGKLLKPICRSENKLRKVWGIGEKLVICYSGNLGRAHDFSTILDAAEKLSNRDDIVFLFIGDGAQKFSVEKEAGSRNLDSVMFQPYQSRVKLNESLSVGDVHLVSLNPSLEGLIVPSKLYGIMAVGRPTIFIGDTAGEVALTIKEGNCGESVEIGSAKELMIKITEYADDKDKRDMHGKNARKVFVDDFNRSNSFAKWLNVLRQRHGN